MHCMKSIKNDCAIEKLTQFYTSSSFIKLDTVCIKKLNIPCHSILKITRFTVKVT